MANRFVEEVNRRARAELQRVADEMGISVEEAQARARKLLSELREPTRLTAEDLKSR